MLPELIVQLIGLRALRCFATTWYHCRIRRSVICNGGSILDKVNRQVSTFSVRDPLGTLLLGYSSMEYIVARLSIDSIAVKGNRNDLNEVTVASKGYEYSILGHSYKLPRFQDL